MFFGVFLFVFHNCSFLKLAAFFVVVFCGGGVLVVFYFVFVLFLVLICPPAPIFKKKHGMGRYPLPL